LTASNAQAEVGQYMTTGGGSSTFSGEENTGGTSSPLGPTNGTYTVSSNGRVALTGSGIATSDPVLYLVNQNEAFIVGTDTLVTSGFMEPQSGAPFTSSLSGSFAGGSIPPVLSTATDQVDNAVGDGSGNLTFTTDLAKGTQLIQDQAATGSCILNSTGLCTGTVTVTQTGTTTTVYIFAVSPTEFYQLYDDQNVTLEHFRQ
jgi:hypothetical protein